MGSITKKPKAPVIQYVTPSAPTSSAETPTTTETAEPQKTDSEIKAEARTQSLLRRSRGRLGTIATSFRGLLGTLDSGSDNQRKTLLGE